MVGVAIRTVATTKLPSGALDTMPRRPVSKTGVSGVPSAANRRALPIEPVVRVDLQPADHEAAVGRHVGRGVLAFGRTFVGTAHRTERHRDRVDGEQRLAERQGQGHQASQNEFALHHLRSPGGLHRATPCRVGISAWYRTMHISARYSLKEKTRGARAPRVFLADTCLQRPSAKTRPCHHPDCLK